MGTWGCSQLITACTIVWRASVIALNVSMILRLVYESNRKDKKILTIYDPPSKPILKQTKYIEFVVSYCFSRFLSECICACENFNKKYIFILTADQKVGYENDQT